MPVSRVGERAISGGGWKFDLCDPGTTPNPPARSVLRATTPHSKTSPKNKGEGGGESCQFLPEGGGRCVGMCAPSPSAMSASWKEQTSIPERITPFA